MSDMQREANNSVVDGDELRSPTREEAGLVSASPLDPKSPGVRAPSAAPRGWRCAPPGARARGRSCLKSRRRRRPRSSAPSERPGQPSARASPRRDPGGGVTRAGVSRLAKYFVALEPGPRTQPAVSTIFRRYGNFKLTFFLVFQVWLDSWELGCCGLRELTVFITISECIPLANPSQDKSQIPELGLGIRWPKCMQEALIPRCSWCQGLVP